MNKFCSHSPEETREFAKKLARLAFPGAVIALWGTLGAGKTAFTQGLALGLDIAGEIASPTFALMHVHEGRLPLYHFDLYRLAGEEDLDTVGADDYWFGRGVSAIEWPQRAGALLPENRLDVEITVGEGTERTLCLTAHGARYEQWLEELP